MKLSITAKHDTPYHCVSRDSMPHKPINPGLNIDPSALSAFKLDQFQLLEKDSTRPARANTTASVYSGPERRDADRRATKDRRNTARFNTSDRRRSLDRRASGASPWLKGYR